MSQVSDEKIDLVQHWLHRLIKELNEVEDIQERVQLVGLCISTLAEHTGTLPEVEKHGINYIA